MFSMTGTTGSSFNGLLATEAGKLGYRNIGGTQYRVRVETEKALPAPFVKRSGVHSSAVVEGEEALAEAIAVGAAAIAGPVYSQNGQAPTVEAPAPLDKTLVLPNGSEIHAYEETRTVVEIDGEEISAEQAAEIQDFLAAFAQ